MELSLMDRDKRLYMKLYTSRSDIDFARDCAKHILKKGWFREPWSRGTIYFQQSVYVTSLAVSYSRPFAIGRNGHAFPNRLIPYTSEEGAFHNHLLDLRNKVHAHSDLDRWEVRPWQSGSFETEMVGQPWLIIKQPKIELFLGMTDRLQTSISQRMKEIIEGY